MKEVQRIIIKVGSSSLVLENGDLNEMFFNKLINTISTLMNNQKEVVLVTSGAIAIGMGKLGLSKKPKVMALKQACAALGQSTLMNEYEKYDYRRIYRKLWFSYWRGRILCRWETCISLIL